MRNSPSAFATCFALLAAGHLPAQLQLPPLRPLGRIVARSDDTLSGPPQFRMLSNGRSIRYDGSARRLVLLDSTLRVSRLIVDTTSPGAAAFGRSPGALLAGRADSSLYIEVGSSTAFVIDPSGQIARREPLASRAFSTPTMSIAASRPSGERLGRILFRAPPPFYLSLVPRTFIGDTIVSGPDSVPLLRYDLATKHTDTAAMLQAPRVRQALSRRESGGRGVGAIDPVPFGGDDWVALDDGTIAIVRMRDYHVDWLHPDRTLTSGPAVAHEWSHVTSAMKVAMIDSLRRALGATKADSTFPLDSAKYDSLAMVAAANPDALLGADGKPTHLGPRPMRMQFVAPGDIPDTWPPFLSGNSMSDVDGNLWILAFPSHPNGGNGVYDVIDRRGVLIDRVELPAGMTLAALGRGFAILQGVTKTGYVIAKARLR